jgi:hypothetical protein
MHVKIPRLGAEEVTKARLRKIEFFVTTRSNDDINERVRNPVTVMLKVTTTEFVQPPGKNKVCSPQCGSAMCLILSCLYLFNFLLSHFLPFIPNRFS